MGILSADEQAAVALRTLYQQYGYRPYRVNSFEEYDLYAHNRRFLTGDQILTFSDTDGKLMALKPDVTLSVVKNTRDGDAPLKVSYAEHVYRVPRGAYGFKEIMQVGVEHIGTVDAYAMGEMLLLAARSLEMISERYALDVSDMGIVSITADCDRDTLLVEVRKDGPACHLGTESCFSDVIFEGDEPPAFQYQDLMDMLRGRRDNPKEGSYTTYLFQKGLDKMLKKVGEETTEVIIAAKDHDRANTIYEIGDLMYHVMVLMLEAGISLEDVKHEMASRHMIDKKVKQEKMV